jgi:hypothetical protein
MKSSQVALAATGLGFFGAPTALQKASEAGIGHFLRAGFEAWRRRGQRIYCWGAAAIADAYDEALDLFDEVLDLFPNLRHSGRPYVWSMHRACNGGP